MLVYAGRKRGASFLLDAVVAETAGYCAAANFFGPERFPAPECDQCQPIGLPCWFRGHK